MPRLMTCNLYSYLHIGKSLLQSLVCSVYYVSKTTHSCLQIVMSVQRALILSLSTICLIEILLTLYCVDAFLKGAAFV